ncbi:hypothetical protein, partial [Bacillus thuringiensis]|uniref:hypothetical protein n=1 Tax=Bacillus thuringiensis TaxID=1428 RepID=UPI000C00B24C
NNSLIYKYELLLGGIKKYTFTNEKNSYILGISRQTISLLIHTSNILNKHLISKVKPWNPNLMIIYFKN